MQDIVDDYFLQWMSPFSWKTYCGTQGICKAHKQQLHEEMIATIGVAWEGRTCFAAALTDRWRKNWQ
ncbi:unnamed protein product [Heligmosomoides polygyrus]|uniref:SCP domain-containing protein n=1 Tax=Heligmosomoides polygyrus TaxID=6339 RepID=A0A183FK90_HELPZ|nr:unnamed protein product [Heligmosomoides polygyrus]